MQIDVPRPTAEASTTWRKDWFFYGFALFVLCMFAVPAVAQTCPAPNQSCQPQFNLDSYDGGQQITINDCQTNSSSSPCAWADALSSDVKGFKTYFLACRLQTTGPIALCYYSGVPGSPYQTPSCTFSQNGNAAECDCYKISPDTPGAGTYSYVEISAILNKDVYLSTVAQCGMDGSQCLNFSDLRSGLQEANICSVIGSKPNGVFPGADLISDFSQIRLFPTMNSNVPPAGDIGAFSQKCPIPPRQANLYAGCMTAPCTNTGKIDPRTHLPLVSCTCPTYDGPNQVGNPQIQGKSCSPTPYVWSSAYADLQ
jgi:hypothetical protein